MSEPTDPDPTRESAMDAADRLLARPASDRYLEAWARSLKRSVYDEDEGDRISVGLFRLGGEHFALETRYVREVHLPRVARPIPGRTGDVFRGLFSLRGEIHLAVDLRSLLGVARPEIDADEEVERRERILVVRKDGARWAFEVDEMLEFRLVDSGTVKPAQVTVSKSAVHFSRGVLEIHEQPVALLDADRLFAGLARSLS